VASVSYIGRPTVTNIDEEELDDEEEDSLTMETT
jgi:hypothetical protein